jgi:hypothetical protein
MRVKSHIWVGAYLRRVMAAGAAAYIARRGDEDAGAIHIHIDNLAGGHFLFSPAPAIYEGAESERRWVAVAVGGGGGGSSGLGGAFAAGGDEGGSGGFALSFGAGGVTGRRGDDMGRARPVAACSQEEAQAYLEAQEKYDPDLWIIEIESREESHFLDDELIAPGRI